MISSIILSGVLLFSGQTLDFPEIWKKIEGKWSYVGEVKEKNQILFWEEKKTKSPNTQILNKERKKMQTVYIRLYSQNNQLFIPQGNTTTASGLYTLVIRLLLNLAIIQQPK